MVTSINEFTLINTMHLDWKNLPFSYIKTDYNVRAVFKNEQWGTLEKSESENINMHIASACLHYGQAVFEGLKAYRGKDNKIRLFRWQDNADRIADSAKKIFMPAIPKDLFFNAIKQVVQLNERFVPPYESGATLYLRPYLFASGVELGVKPATKYSFITFASPVGPYFKGGFQAIDILMDYKHDRAAPLGTGNIKFAGNYAASLPAIAEAKKYNCDSVLFLDAKEKKYIDECGHANFFGIKNNTYVTPKSDSILPSITNKSVTELAKKMGLKIEKRQIPIDELETFEEVGACGTAAIINPIKKIIDNKEGKTYEYCPNNKPGPICTKLYNELRSIQYGDAKDEFGWITIIND